VADFVFNIAKGKIAQYAGLTGGANDQLILVVCLSANLETDSTLKDYDTLSALLAGTTDECTFTGYARRTLGSVTVTVDDTNDRVDIDAADPASYTNTGGSSQAAGKAIICYDPDTTTGTDADLVPLFGLDCVVTFDVSVPITLSFAAAGIGRAA